MKKLSKYAFLIKHSSYSYHNNSAMLNSNEFSSNIVGVKDAAEAIEMVNKLINDGIELIELCGGFTAEEELEIRKAMIAAVPLGRAVLNLKDEDLLKNNLSE